MSPVTQYRYQCDALDFVFGNLSLSTHHKPARESFFKVAHELYAWDRETFDAWARSKEWER